MSRPELCFVDATILGALITPGSTSDKALRWLRAGQDSWITSEISMALCLANLTAQGISPTEQQACMDRLLLVLRHGIGLRPLPIQSLGPPQGLQAHRLPPLQLLQLQAALHGRCGCLMSNDSALVTASRRAGLPAFGLTLAAATQA